MERSSLRLKVVLAGCSVLAGVFLVELALFVLGTNPHFNEAGYERLAESIRSELLQ